MFSFNEYFLEVTPISTCAMVLKGYNVFKNLFVFYIK